MKQDNFKIYSIESSTEEKLFTEALIFFDTSSLLDFYYLSEKNKEQIYIKLFEHVKNRLFVTTQTEYEILKNRDKVILKPLETYNSLITKSKNNKDSGHLDEIEQLLNILSTKINTDVSGQFKTLIEKTSRNDKHPYIENFNYEEINTNTESLIKSISDYKEQYKQFRIKFEKSIDDQKEKIISTIENDTVLVALEKYFQTTEKLTYKQILAIVKEGELRYRNEIPPGYLDEENKSGFQIYGDLIMWKQIIRESKKQNKSAILVINDLKDDWWHIHDEDKPLTPRHELIKEFNDETGKNFWMYDINSFLYKSNQYIQTRIEESVIDEIKEINYQIQHNESPIIKDWIETNYNCKSEITFIENVYDQYGVDYLIQNLAGNNIVFKHKQLNSITYVKLLEPIRTFIANFPYLRKHYKAEELVLIIEYLDFEKAKTFTVHARQKKTLRSLINRFRNIIRLVVIVSENDSYETIFDSYEKNGS